MLCLHFVFHKTEAVCNIELNIKVAFLSVVIIIFILNGPAVCNQCANRVTLSPQIYLHTHVLSHAHTHTHTHNRLHLFTVSQWTPTVNCCTFGYLAHSGCCLLSALDIFQGFPCSFTSSSTKCFYFQTLQFFKVFTNETHKSNLSWLAECYVIQAICWDVLHRSISRESGQHLSDNVSN